MSSFDLGRIMKSLHLVTKFRELVAEQIPSLQASLIVETFKLKESTTLLLVVSTTQ